MYRRPKISVVIPVYNVAAYLPACLESVLNQAFDAFEVLAVNDGSTDESAQILARFKTRCPHLICLEQPNAGANAARRAGLARAEGEYVCFVDGDDFIGPDYLSALYQAAQTYGADLALAQTVRWFTPEKQTQDGADVFAHPVLRGDARGQITGFWDGCMSLCGKLIRMETARALTWPQTRRQEDVFPAVQAVALARTAAPAAGAQYFYRQNRSGSLSAGTDGRFVRAWKAFADAADFLRRQNLYAAFAPYFEWTRWRVLLSHAAAYGLTDEEWAFVKKNKRAVQAVPLRLLAGRPWKTRIQFMGLKAALGGGFSYPRCVRLWRGVKTIFWKKRPTETSASPRCTK